MTNRIEKKEKNLEIVGPLSSIFVGQGHGARILGAIDGGGGGGCCVGGVGGPSAGQRRVRMPLIGFPTIGDFQTEETQRIEHHQRNGRHYVQVFGVFRMTVAVYGSHCQSFNHTI